ncbi:MAG: BatD family protein [Campylobacterales bacterium]
MKTKRHPGNFMKSMVNGQWSMARLKAAAVALLFISTAAFADVEATVDSPAVFRGDPVTLTLTASGEDIEFPPLTEIAGYPIQGRGTSRNLSIVNGHTTKSLEQRLVFTPTDDLTIPSLDITVDGKVEHTLPIRVKVNDPQAAPKGAPVRMELKLSKEKAYVGEPVELDLVFKYLPGTQIDDIRISEPKLEHFWIKRLNTQAERSADSEGYITQTYRYLLFAQQSGDLAIPAIFAQIGTKVQTKRNSMFSDPFFNDPFFGGARMQYKKVYSEPATLHAQALPAGLEVYGRFTMESDVDKTTVEANKPVNLHIHIEGSGNVEDIPKFEPRIGHAVVYANDPEIKSFIKDGRYYGTFDQTIAVIPGRDTTIEPLTFAFFDSKAKKETTLSTHPYFIKVNGSAVVPKAATPVIESAAPAQAAVAPAAEGSRRVNLYEALGIFTAGFAVGAAFIWMLLLRRTERTPRRAVPSPMAKQLKAAKKDRELFELLLPRKGESPLIDETLAYLEANLYRGAKHGIDRKALTAYFNGQTQKRIDLV